MVCLRTFDVAIIERDVADLDQHFFLAELNRLGHFFRAESVKPVHESNPLLHRCGVGALGVCVRAGVGTSRVGSAIHRRYRQSITLPVVPQ